MSADNTKRLGDSIIENAIKHTEVVNEVIRLREALSIAREALAVSSTAICSEYCTTKKHNAYCKQTTEALAKIEEILKLT